jgi:hypothetical protein
MAIFNAIKLLSVLLLLLEIVNARLSSKRRWIEKREKSFIDHREMQQGVKESKATKKPKQTKAPGDRAGKGKRPTGSGSGSGPSPFCSVLPALDASAPPGAKLFLYGACDQIDAFPVTPDGIISYGACEIYTKSSRTAQNNIGTMRYQMDAGMSNHFLKILLFMFILFGIIYTSLLQLMLDANCLNISALHAFLLGPILHIK